MEGGAVGEELSGVPLRYERTLVACHYTEGVDGVDFNFKNPHQILAQCNFLSGCNCA